MPLCGDKLPTSRHQHKIATTNRLRSPTFDCGLVKYNDHGLETPCQRRPMDILCRIATASTLHEGRQGLLLCPSFFCSQRRGTAENFSDVNMGGWHRCPAIPLSEVDVKSHLFSISLPTT